MSDDPETQVPSAAGEPLPPTQAVHVQAIEPLVVGAVSVFVFRGDRMLALKRSAKSDAAAGAWDAVSGRLRAGEHPRDAAVRESREETGLEVLPDDTPLVAYTARRAEAPMLVVAYRAESGPGEVTISSEHDEFAWMTVDEFARACRFPLLVDAARRAGARGAVPDDPHVIMWEFRVKAGSEAAFEAAYGRGGDWERLFRRDPGFRGTELLRVSTPRGYITIDRWVSAAAFETFQKRHRKDYEALDRRLASLTERETALGRLERVPARPGFAGEPGLASSPVLTGRPATAGVPETTSGQGATGDPEATGDPGAASGAEPEQRPPNE